MKIYIILLVLTSLIYAGTYNDKYDVLNKDNVEENYDVLMNGDFTKILRFKEIIFVDNKIDKESQSIIEEVSKTINNLKKENEDILVSIIGHTNSTTDDLNEKKVDSDSYANKSINLFRYSLNKDESAQLSNSYANTIADELIKKGSDKKDQIIEYRNGNDNLYTEEVSKIRDLSNRVMVGIYVIPQKILDSDNDGIMDRNDICPDTLESLAVDEKGCPLDSDKDGVIDYYDKCTDTSSGLIVNKFGCHIYKTLRLNFKRNSSEIGEDSLSRVVGFSKFLLDNKIYNIEIIGHTDSRSSIKYNRALSLRRANALKKFLVTSGIDSSSIITKGAGEGKPIATNDTSEGRSLNRRIEVIIKLKDN